MKFKQNIIKWNLEKYNYNKELYNKCIVKSFMENANTHLISTFKDYLFYDDFTEFFTKYYCLYESINILLHLLTYYEKSSYIFPNYTAINEGKYIYKNIIKKQILINYLEDLEIKRRNDVIFYKINKNSSKINNNEKIFESKLYNNIINYENNSNINILFGIKINKNEENPENDSINTLKKLINIINESSTKSVGTNTVNINSYNNKKVKKGKNRNNISPKSIINSTNYTSNISNSNINNINSMFKIDKKIIVNSDYNNNTNICINQEKSIFNNENISKSNINLNFSIKKNLKVNKKLSKINTQSKTKSFKSNINSSFIKSVLCKTKEKKLISDKNLINLIKSKNRNISNKKKQGLTPIEKIKHHLSICSIIIKETKMNKYLTNLPSIDNNHKINLKYKKIKINKKNKLFSNHAKSKSKFDIKLNKVVFISNNHNNRHQRNKIINTDYNSHLYNSKKNSFNVSLNNLYKTINMNKTKKSIFPMTHFNKNKTISLSNNILQNDNNSKNKFFTNNISKKKIISKNIVKEEEKKKKSSKKIITSYFSSKLPSPHMNKKNIFKTYFNSLNKDKKHSLIKDFITINNLKYFKKKNISYYKNS